MRIEIFEPDLSNRHEITHAISVQFSVKYNDVGKFTIVLPMDAYRLSVVFELISGALPFAISFSASSREIEVPSFVNVDLISVSLITVVFSVSTTLVTVFTSSIGSSLPPSSCT